MASTATTHQPDRRLLPHILHHAAAQTPPPRIYASIPVSPSDLSAGYRDVTYTQLLRAVDRAARWLDATLPPPPTTTTTRPTFAYLGPRDLRYPIHVLAAIKTSRRLLIPSHLASPAAHVHLLASSSTSTVIHADAVLPDPHVSQIRAALPSIQVVTNVPSQEELLFDDEQDVEPYAYAKTFAEAEHDDACVFHTSGSTGPPKLVPYTHGMLVKVLAKVDLLSAQSRPRQLQGEVEAGWRCYIALPIYHVRLHPAPSPHHHHKEKLTQPPQIAGMKHALLNPLLRNTTVVLGPPTPHGPNTPQTALLVLHHARPHAATFPPALLADLVQQHRARALPLLARLRSVSAAGAPVAPAAGAALAALGTFDPAIGCTESMHWLTLRPANPADWPYVAFHAAMGARMDAAHRGRDDGHDDETLHELVFDRTPSSEAWTVFFDRAGPGVREFRTKDLWARHPTDPGLWRYRGRTDDLVVLTGEVKMYAGRVEERLCGADGVRAALVGGEGRVVPFVLVEAAETPSSDAERGALLERLWPAVERENRNMVEQTRLRKQLAFVAPRDKPFARLGKGAVARRETFKLFEEEIEIMYRNSGL